MNVAANSSSDFDKDSIRRDRRSIEDLLIRAGARNTNRPNLCCPFHDDRTPSAQIRKSQDTGFWYFYCFVCDLAHDHWALLAHLEGRGVEDVLAEARRGESEPATFYRPVLRQREAEPEKPVRLFSTIDAFITELQTWYPNVSIEERNEYVNPDTRAIELVTVRFRYTGVDKTFLQLSPQGSQWALQSLKGDNLPLFNRTRVRNAKRVLFVEGEKCVYAVTELKIPDLAATTLPGGSKNGKRGDLSPLAGKVVYVWPDNDGEKQKFAGQQFADDIVEGLKALVPQPTIYRIDPAQLELKEKQDVFDYLADADGTREDKVTALELALLDAECITDTGGLGDWLGKIESGEIRVAPIDCLPVVSRLTQAIIPTAVTAICAEAGSGKSLLHLDMLRQWVESGDEDVVGLMLEDTTNFHQQRLLAQMSGQSDILDYEFLRDNQGWATDIYKQFRERIDNVAKYLECTNSREMTLKQVGDWIEEQIVKKKKKRVIVDPITAAATGPKPWEDDRKFMLRIKRLAEMHFASIVLFTHPRTGKPGQPSLSGMAGGAAYPRFSWTVLWIKHLEKAQDSKVIQEYGTQTIEHRRVIEIRKARNGRGSGQKVAVDLSPENLCFVEHGLIMGD